MGVSLLGGIRHRAPDGVAHEPGKGISARSARAQAQRAELQDEQHLRDGESGICSGSCQDRRLNPGHFG
jgi:hypothetical protein